MKRIFALVNYESRANENGWRTKYFWPEIVETDIEAELGASPKGTIPGPNDAAKIVEYLKTSTSFAWKTKILETYAHKKGVSAEQWMVAKAREYGVFNLAAVEKLCRTGSILNTLEPEHQMAYQFNL